jgi:C1A family cysteine protease
MSIHKYGFKKSMHVALKGANINLGFTAPSHLPDVIDLRNKMPAVFDQSTLGSCTANALAGGMEYLQNDNIVPSRLFLYYNEREIDGTVNEDSGSTITTGIHSLNTQGICPENEWEYNVGDFKIKPPVKCYTDAKKELLTGFTQLSNVLDIHKSLAAGFPVAFGIQLFSYMESENMAKTGILHMPDLYRETYLGGHALLIVGINTVKDIAIIRNSWGQSWGQDGYFTAPLEYIANPQLASDFWSMHKID